MKKRFIGERLLEKLEKRGDCWVWKGSLRSTGYGQIGVYHEGIKPAHRVMYELCFGEVPKELTIDHLCEVKTCCNPRHMEVVTRGENVKRYFIRNKHKFSYKPKPKVCMDCGGSFYSYDKNKVFCNTTCKQLFKIKIEKELKDFQRHKFIWESVYKSQDEQCSEWYNKSIWEQITAISASTNSPPPSSEMSQVNPAGYSLVIAVAGEGKLTVRSMPLIICWQCDAQNPYCEACHGEGLLDETAHYVAPYELRVYRLLKAPSKHHRTHHSEDKRYCSWPNQDRIMRKVKIRINKLIWVKNPEKDAKVKTTK